MKGGYILKDGYILKEKISGCKQYITIYVEHGKEIVAKRCTKCFEIKDLSLYVKRKNAFCGVVSACKDCQNKRNKNYYAKNKDVIDEKHRQYKINNLEKERARMRQYRSEHLEEYKEYREANKEHLLQYSKQWREVNKDYAKEKGKQYYQANKEVAKANRRNYYSENREQVLEIVKKWAIENPDKKRAYTYKRRTLKALLPSTLTPEHYMPLLDIQEGTCYLSGETENLHLEHFIPLSWGAGGTTFENCYYMEGSLNISKFNNNPFAWIQTQPEEYQQRFHNILVPMMAERNGMTVKEFEVSVNEAHENYIKQPEEFDA